mmetsp:Transcript_27269/g.40589  ORF Transcript_27269/g.40589 Transcript_27269/m.40589 type:complete len:80 (+) Transcript_27269:1-240(+)
MPSYEWDTTWKYHEAMVDVISAIFKVTKDVPYNDDFESDSEVKDVEMVVVEDVVVPVEDDSSDDSEDESSDDSADNGGA